MISPLRLMIVDDEAPAREVLRFLLEEMTDRAEIVAEAGSVLEAVKAVQTAKPDLLLLDVQMPHADGFDLLESFPERNWDVIFTTSHPDYAIRAIRNRAIDYLLKPIDEDDLRAALAQVQEKRAEREKTAVPDRREGRLKVNVGKETVFLPIEEVVRAEASGAYCVVHTLSGKSYSISRNLGHLEQQLENLDFFRVHHSHLVNLQLVRGIVNKDGGFVRMSDEGFVPISARKLAPLN
ncbi:MAG: LytTR family DNA-binding domain-containing protein, partial [Bacteroidota bacterium]